MSYIHDSVPDAKAGSHMHAAFSLLLSSCLVHLPGL